MSVQALENQLKQAEEALNRRAQLQRLMRNRDFKALIMDYFCKEAAAHYAQESADPALNDRQREDALALAQAPGHLRRFLAVIEQQGNHAEAMIPQIKDTIIEVQNEE